MKIKKIPFLILILLNSFIVVAQTEESKKFIEALASGNTKEAYGMFDTVITNKLPESQLQVIWTGIQAQAGKFKNYLTTREEGETTFTACEFERMSYDIKLIFNKQKKITGFYFVNAKSFIAYQKPEYDLPDLYLTRHLSVKTGNFLLPAELLLPTGKKDVPLVIMVQGSGASDKDETIGPNKIFRDLAVGLAASGIATLRYDKRTRVYGTTIKADSITYKEEVTEDVASAIALAKSIKEINPSKLYILGHSFGGMLAPFIAEENFKDVHGIILLAANARPLQDLLLEQTTYILSLDGLNDAEKEQLDEIKKQIAVSKSAALTTKTPSNELPLNIPASYWIALNAYKPLEVIKKTPQQILVLQGENDYQVTVTDFNLWKKQLASSNNATFKLYPKLNHLFIEGDKKSQPSEYEKAGNMAAYVIADIASWINTGTIKK